jgi:poly [ADP-ribose] polymerase 10/14/15
MSITIGVAVGASIAFVLALVFLLRRCCGKRPPDKDVEIDIEVTSTHLLYQQMKQPETWSAMKNQQTAERFALLPGPERDHVCQAFMKTLNSSIKVVDVQRIQNIQLWRQYATKRWEFVSREGPSSQDRNERVWLFHGTEEDTVEKIVQQGFNRSFAGKNATAYGKGVYFARDASCKAANRTCLSNAVHLQPAKQP